MNIVHVKRGESVAISAGVPHAYIQGELCECMINSDNVVRGGLTPKLKDVTTLLSILPFDQCGTQTANKPAQPNDKGLIEYLYPGFEEAKVSLLPVSQKEMTSPLSFKLSAILIVLSGSAVTSEGIEMSQFSTWFLMPGAELAVRKTSEEDLLIAIASSHA